MRRAKTIVAFVLFAFAAAALVRAAASSEVVTNPTPAVSATMTLTGASPVGDGTTAFSWTVQGKVKPAYRGFGGDVRIVCQPYASIRAGGNEGQIVLGACDLNNDFCASVDACGNFSFNATIVGDSPQLDNRYVCTFIVHADASKTPQACSAKTTPGDIPSDPNGSAPCSGGFCPSAR